ADDPPDRVPGLGFDSDRPAEVGAVALTGRLGLADAVNRLNAGNGVAVDELAERGLEADQQAACGGVVSEGIVEWATHDVGRSVLRIVAVADVRAAGRGCGLT